ncbi:MAG TPA: YkvA family protein [Halanaerobiales bacterium]|nr:YkvA family protein [Halanaerobiales bacterium]
MGVFNLTRIFRFLTDRNVELSKKLLFLLPFIYLLSPIDLISDFFPLAGQLDDIAVFVLFWPLLKSLLSNYSYETSTTGNKKAKEKSGKDTVDIDIDKDDYTVV